jgi:hypothetical protein
MLERATEVTEPHTQLLRVTLEVDNARAYWQRATNPPAVSAEQEAEQAFVEFWFGTKSMQRLRNLIAAFRARFAVFPGALEALQAWPDMDRQTRVLVCHWHLQLSDPLYRRFTGDYLVERRQGGRGTVSRGPVLRWMGEVDVDERWSAATRAGFASKLLSAAHAAGPRRLGPRPARPVPAAGPGRRARLPDVPAAQRPVRGQPARQPLPALGRPRGRQRRRQAARRRRPVVPPRR